LVAGPFSFALMRWMAPPLSIAIAAIAIAAILLAPTP